jgi:hypothetical protein
MTSSGGEVIDTRVPRSVFGKLRIGADVHVVDDSVEPQLYRVIGLSNGERDVRLLALGPGSIEATIAAKIASTDIGAELSREGITTVSLDEMGRMIEHRPDGTTSVIG